MLLLVSPVGAADPSPPPPVDFPSPQMIVAVDRLEWLGDDLEHNDYILASPDDAVSPGNYDYVDATGGLFHFYGRDIAGPYAKRADVCPFMSEHGLAALGTGVVDDTNPTVTTEECVAAAAGTVAEPVAAEDPAATDAAPDVAAAGSSNDPTEDGSDDPIALEIAIALILLILGIGGLTAAGVGPLARRRPIPAGGVDLAVGIEPTPTIAPLSQVQSPNADDQDPRPDPCSGEVAALETASAHARGLNSVLAGLRDFAAQLEGQIVLIEKAAIPTELAVEGAFLAGGAIGGAMGPGWIPDILLGKIVEGVAKDQLKGVIKSALSNAALQGPEASAAARDGLDSGAQSALKGMLEEAVSNHYLGASIKGYHTSASALANSLPGKFAAADRVGGHMAEAVGNLVTLYGSSVSLATLVGRSGSLRRQEAAILDDIAELEAEFASATERMTELAADLQRCRWVHSATTAPLRPD